MFQELKGRSERSRMTFAARHVCLMGAE